MSNKNKKRTLRELCQDVDKLDDKIVTLQNKKRKLIEKIDKENEFEKNRYQTFELDDKILLVIDKDRAFKKLDKKQCNGLKRIFKDQLEWSMSGEFNEIDKKLENVIENDSCLYRLRNAKIAMINKIE